jgi:hypothetical protein
MRISMTRSTLFRALPALGALIVLASCAEVETRPNAVAPTPPLPYAWNGDGVPGPAKIIVDINQQRAYFFKGKAMVGETTVSTGKPGFSTPPGSYKVVWKDKDHISTRFGDYVDDYGNVVKSNIDSAKDPRPKGAHYDGARMPYAMFFRGGYAMHQGYVPPYAASHGCIRLPNGIAEIFFNAVELGTPVIVKESSAESYSLAEPNNGPQSFPAAVTVPPPAPNLVRSTPPASVRPASVRSMVPAPTPVPVRSPAAVLSRAPAPVRSPSPAAVRSTPPVSVRPTSVRSTVVAPTPIPVRSLGPTPGPVVSRPPASVRPTRTSVSPTPTPVPIPVRSPSPAPVRSPAPATVRPTPTPVPARHHRPARSRRHVRSPAPSPTPTPTPTR